MTAFALARGAVDSEARSNPGSARPAVSSICRRVSIGMDPSAGLLAVRCRSYQKQALPGARTENEKLRPGRNPFQEGHLARQEARRGRDVPVVVVPWREGRLPREFS